MDQEAVGNIVLLAIVTLISVVQNGKGGPSLGVGLVFRCLRVRLTHLCVCVCICVYIFFLSVFVSLFDCTGCVYFRVNWEFSFSPSFFCFNGDD